jgi:micrococcal nuclease
MTGNRNLILALLLLCLFGALVGCTELDTTDDDSAAPPNPVQGETATVTWVIDGDTIDVRLNGETVRVRYIGINTPEQDEVCYQEATDANAALVRGQTVTLVKDVSNTDKYGRLLRYVYVGDVFVNAELVARGYAESVHYPPDTTNAAYFDNLEASAKANGMGCHPTGVFE